MFMRSVVPIFCLAWVLICRCSPRLFWLSPSFLISVGLHPGVRRLACFHNFVDWIVLQDPDLIAAFSDPEIMAALQIVMRKPANFDKHQANLKVGPIIAKMNGPSY
ncbi:uncharacterized protein [Lolium perenne]